MADAKVEIEIRRRRPAKPVQGDRKGPLSVRRDSDPLARRHLGKGIRVFDLGYRLTGPAFVTNAAQVVPNIDFTRPDYTFPVRTMTPADFALMTSNILADGAANFAALFKEVRRGDNSDKYGLWANIGGSTLPFDTLTEWTTDGFKLRQDQLDSGVLILDTKALFLQLGSGLVLKDAQFGQKITSGSTYGSPAVPFSPAFKMKVFLMPALSLSKAFSQYTLTSWPLPGTPPPGTFAFYLGYLNLFWVVVPRGWVIDPSDSHYNLYSGGIGNVVPPGQTAAYQVVINKSASHATLPLTRGTTRDLSFSEAAAYFSYVAPADVHSGPSGLYPAQNGLDVGFTRGSVAGADRNGLLLAVVEKGGSFFYFWSDGY